MTTRIIIELSEFDGKVRCNRQTDIDETSTVIERTLATQYWNVLGIFFNLLDSNYPELKDIVIRLHPEGELK